MKRALILAMAVAGCMALIAAEAKAGHRGHGFAGPAPYYGFGFGYGYNHGSLYGLGFLPVPPYYAIHPPVYYSKPVARTYGRSPFAALPYDGYDGRAEEVRPRPVVRRNPYVEELPPGQEQLPAEQEAENPSEPEGPQDTGKTDRSARFIVNPFYQSGSLADTQLADSERPPAATE